MNFIKNLFSRNGNSVNSGNEETAVDEKFINPEFEKLFMEDNPPEEKTEFKRVNILNNFFSKNYSNIGFEFGYEYHTSQSLEKVIQSIKAEYQHLLGVLVDEKENEIYCLEIHKIQTEGISDSILQQLDLRIKKLHQSIEKCKSELNLSADGKGHIETLLMRFKEGFEKGMTQYFNEKFLAQSTGLFN